MVPMMAKMDMTSTQMTRILPMDLIDDSSPVTTICITIRKCPPLTYLQNTLLHSPAICKVFRVVSWPVVPLSYLLKVQTLGHPISTGTPSSTITDYTAVFKVIKMLGCLSFPLTYNN